MQDTTTAVLMAYEEQDPELADQAPALTPRHVLMLRAIVANRAGGDRA